MILDRPHSVRTHLELDIPPIPPPPSTFDALSCPPRSRSRSPHDHHHHDGNQLLPLAGARTHYDVGDDGHDEDEEDDHHDGDHQFICRSSSSRGQGREQGHVSIPNNSTSHASLDHPSCLRSLTSTSTSTNTPRFPLHPYNTRSRRKLEDALRTASMGSEKSASPHERMPYYNNGHNGHHVHSSREQSVIVGGRERTAGRAVRVKEQPTEEGGGGGGGGEEGGGDSSSRFQSHPVTDRRSRCRSVMYEEGSHSALNAHRISAKQEPMLPTYAPVNANARNATKKEEVVIVGVGRKKTQPKGRRKVVKKEENVTTPPLAPLKKNTATSSSCIPTSSPSSSTYDGQCSTTTPWRTTSTSKYGGKMMHAKKQPRKKTCAIEHCTNLTQGKVLMADEFGSPGPRCARHGGGRRCSKNGCIKIAKGKVGDGEQRCARHGGGKRCNVDSCRKIAKGDVTVKDEHGMPGSRCGFHGGGERCCVEECNSIAKGVIEQDDAYGKAGPRCFRHNGGKRCEIVGCNNIAQARVTDIDEYGPPGSRCGSHGGSKRCSVKGCRNIAKGSLSRPDELGNAGGRCQLHKGGLRCAVTTCESYALDGHENEPSNARCYRHKCEAGEDMSSLLSTTTKSSTDGRRKRLREEGEITSTPIGNRSASRVQQTLRRGSRRRLVASSSHSWSSPQSNATTHTFDTDHQGETGADHADDASCRMKCSQHDLDLQQHLKQQHFEQREHPSAEGVWIY